MPRLIDADKLIINIVHKYGRDQSDAVLEIAEAPTVDAAPVVRCKECNCFERNNTKKGEVLYCYYHEMNIKEDDFCAWGERRENEQTN